MGLSGSTPISSVSAEGPFKFYYFPIEGAGEKVRLAFVLAGIEFEDVRIPPGEWQALKPKTRYGQLPMLKIGTGSEELYQSDAMMKYVALASENTALYPKDDPAKLVLIEEMLLLLTDLQNAWAPCLLASIAPAKMGYDAITDEEKAALAKKLREKFLKDDLPKFCGFLTQALAASGSTFLVGPEPTIADCKALPQLRYYTRGIADHIPADCLKPYPAVVAYLDRMMALPAIAKWYDK